MVCGAGNVGCEEQTARQGREDPDGEGRRNGRRERVR